MRLPGDVHSALLAAGLIPDPYHGRNEYDVRWVADRDWTLRAASSSRATAPRPSSRTSLDTVAEIRINGHFVIAHATRPSSTCRPDVAGRWFRARTASTSSCAPPPAPPMRGQAEQPFPVPYHAGNCPIPNGNMLRKPQCDFGWDWNIALAPVGVHGRIGLVGPEGLIDEVPSASACADPVTLEIDVALRGFAADTVPWSVAVCGGTATGEAEAGADFSLARAELDDPRPGALVAGRPRPAAGPRPRGPRRRHQHAARSPSATSASSPSPTPPAAASRSTSTAARSSPAAPTGSRPTRCPAASPKRRPAPSCSPPPTPT